MNVAVIVASGVGSRMKSDMPKQFLPIKDKLILFRTIEIFLNNEQVDKVVVVISKEMQAYYDEKIGSLLTNDKEIIVVYGGKERYESVYNGLKVVPKDTNLVLIHDGARPFVRNEEINTVITLADEKGAAILAKPLTDTVKLVRDGCIYDTPDRSVMFGAMTPQVFKYSIIMEAYERLKIDNKIFTVTDDAMVVERFCQEVYIVEGSQDNIKITNPIDLIIGKAILDNRGED